MSVPRWCSTCKQRIAVKRFSLHIRRCHKHRDLDSTAAGEPILQSASRDDLIDKNDPSWYRTETEEPHEVAHDNSSVQNAPEDDIVVDAVENGFDGDAMADVRGGSEDVVFPDAGEPPLGAC